MPQVSYCNLADLKAAILGIDPDEMRAKYGLPPKYAKGYCLNCGKPRKKKLFCNKLCWHEYTHIKAVCSQCGRMFIIEKSQLIARTKMNKLGLLFCSKQCSGQYNGLHYGFSKHPENAEHKQKKHDYDLVYELQAQTGWGCSKLSRALNIPESTVSYILRVRT